MQIKTRQVAQAVILTAIAVVFSPLFIPVGPTKVFPAQHMVNVLAGVLLGPWYAVAIATAAAIIRVSVGTGTVFAFPGGMIGAFLCGMAFRYFRNIYIAALGEILGTGILGAMTSTFIVAPLLLNKTMGWAALIVPFLASTICGSIIGVLGLLVLKRAGYGPAERQLTES
jgi:energy coupling factor transporter S component ThiW